MKIAAHVNENYFSLIDSEDKAYFLGLLFADGCVLDKTNGQKCLILSLQERDKHILQEMKKYLSYEGNITTRKRQQPQHKDQCALRIYSETLCQGLINLGCTPRKSKTAQFPINKFSDTLLRHFVRGLFDGDGSISIQKKGQFRFDISGTSSICNELNNIFVNQLGLKSRKIINRKNLSVFAVCGNKNIRKIYEFLYKNSTVFLKRKEEKFKKVFIGPK